MLSSSKIKTIESKNNYRDNYYKNNEFNYVKRNVKSSINFEDVLNDELERKGIHV